MSAVWRRLHDLSLNSKLTLTLAAAFATSALVYFVALVPLQHDQAARLLEQHKRLLTTLRESYQRNLIYDLLSENDPSLEVDLADLARQPGVLWVRIEAGAHALSVTADPALLRLALGPEFARLEAAPPETPALLVYDDGHADVTGAGGRVLLAAPAVLREHLPRWRGDEAPFAERPLDGDARGETALYALSDLKAADTVYGRLHVLYSLAELRRSAALTRTLFYGLVGTSFTLLLVLLNLFIARIVIAPLRRLVGAMQAASTGALDVRLPVPADDELGRMAASFNRMASDLAASKRDVELYSRDLEARVDERTRALRTSEAALMQVKDHLATILANVDAGVVSLDEHARVATCNRRAVEILGLGREPPAGAPFEAVLAEGEGARLAALVAPVSRGAERRAEGQLELRLPQGRRMLAVVASALPAAGGRPAGCVVVFDDLTQILASQRLEAWKQAVERVIHEIKNPLTPVGLAAEMLQSAHERDRERFDQLFPSACQMILNSVRDLKSLIAEFTQFSRLPPPQLVRVDLNALVAETLAAYATAPPEAVAVKLELAGELPSLEGDAQQLRRVLLNVVNNAIEAMAGRAGELRVSTAFESGRLRVRVRDQGAGVEDVDRLFEPYYTTKVKGTGLGLLIARQIVEEHGGRILVQSELGVGTTVTVDLPPAPASGEP